MKAQLKEQKNKGQTGRKYLQNTCLIKDCYPKYAKNSKLSNKKTKNSTKKWANI